MAMSHDMKPLWLSSHAIYLLTAAIGAGQDAMLSMPSDGVLIFSAGSMNGEEACATFTVISDDTLEGDESFQVSLDSPTGGANLDDPMTATATITDNESMLIMITIVIHVCVTWK